MSNEGLEEIVEKLDYNEAYGFSEKNVKYEDFEKGLSSRHFFLYCCMGRYWSLHPNLEAAHRTIHETDKTGHKQRSRLKVFFWIIMSLQKTRIVTMPRCRMRSMSFTAGTA